MTPVRYHLLGVEAGDALSGGCLGLEAPSQGLRCEDDVMGSCERVTRV